MTQARLNQMIKYRDEAIQNPDHNKLYIEDLNESIKHLEITLAKPIEINSGFELTKET